MGIENTALAPESSDFEARLAARAHLKIVLESGGR
jgi:hypothetical protein